MSVKGFQIDSASLEGDITHDNLIGVGSNTHPQIDTHIADVALHNTDYVINTATGPVTYNSIVAEDVILVDAAGGDVTVQLQTVATTRGRALNIKRIDNSANVVTVQGAGSPVETIDGNANIIISTQYDNLTIINSSAEWHIL